MGYYRRYYTQRDYAVTKVSIKSAGGCGIESIFFQEEKGDNIMVEDNTDTPTACSCGSCDDPNNCECDPDMCDCGKNTVDPFNKSHMFKNKG